MSSFDRRHPSHRVLNHTEASLEVPNLPLLAQIIHIADDVLGIGVKNLAFPESNGSKAEEDQPGAAHQDRHDEVPYAEAFDVEYITNGSYGKYPTDFQREDQRCETQEKARQLTVRECQRPAF